jgi:drug/metabolite transporter (DMT)-like permease
VTERLAEQNGYSRKVTAGWLPWLAAVLAVGSFAATFPVTRALLAHLSPWYVATSRVLIAGAVAAAVLVVLRAPIPPRATWPALVFASLGVAVGFPVLSALALVDIAASSAGAQAGILPLLTAFFAVIFTKERPLARFWWASLFGSFVVIGYALWENGLSWRAGNNLLFAAMFSAALGYVAGARAAAALPAWQVTCWLAVLGVLPNLVLLLLFAPSGQNPIAQLIEVPWLSLGILHLALLGQLFAFIAWNYALASGGIARVGQVQLLQPFITLAIAAAWLGETISPLMLVTVLAVLLAIAIAKSAGPAAVPVNDAVSLPTTARRKRGRKSVNSERFS